ncbi:D-serine/D-alanine/glycine transporter [Candidatus Fukatsuia anoeciicola]|uniref:D-serine/D-alanine/glycine transporter n=1 Tax=Candidatus Fukatsuia anoeciicola TaxID=2994492 RepID=UPI003463A3B5
MIEQIKIDRNSKQKEIKYLQRNLSNRHIQLIAIGGAIGTGLFMGAGKSISIAGPSIIFVYMIIGFILFFVMRAMGELLLSNIEYKSFSNFATDLLGSWAGFFTGWTYWFCWIITGVADIIAVTAYIQFWLPEFSYWFSSLLVILLLLSLNWATVKIFGEIEFWFAMIKIISIMVLIIISITMVLMSYPSISGSVASFNHLWSDDGGMFPQGLMGFFASFQIAIFSFVGIELVGTTAAETKDPKVILPRAINAIPIRIILFYIFSLMMIISVIPWNFITIDKNPFVELFILAGLPTVASIINFVVLTSALSSANSGIFSTSRILFGLALEGDAPKQFSQLSRYSVPIFSLTFSCICLLGGVILIYLIPNIITIFTLVTTVSAILFMFVWTIILCSYLVYRKKHPELHGRSTYKMPAGILMSVVCLIFFAFILILLAFETHTRQALMVTPLWFIILSAAYWLLQKYKIKLQ